MKRRHRLHVIIGVSLCVSLCAIVQHALTDNTTTGSGDMSMTDALFVIGKMQSGTSDEAAFRAYGDAQYTLCAALAFGALRSTSAVYRARVGATIAHVAALYPTGYRPLSQERIELVKILCFLWELDRNLTVRIARDRVKTCRDGSRLPYLLILQSDNDSTASEEIRQFGTADDEALKQCFSVLIRHASGNHRSEDTDHRLL